MNSISSKQYSPNFNSLHINKGVLKDFKCTDQYFLRDPKIKQFAQKYEVIIERGNIIGHKHNKNNDFLINMLGGILSSAFGLFLGFATTIYTATKNAEIGPTGIQSMIFGVIMGPLLFAFGKFITPSKPQYDYTLQLGKKIKKDYQGNNKFLGPTSEKFRFTDISDFHKLPDLSKEIFINDYNLFKKIISNYNIDYLDVTDILNILKNLDIKENFSNGDCFNYKINKNSNSLLTRFFDIIPNKKNINDYQQIINIMNDMHNINYNQLDPNGISVLEKIINSENSEILNLVKDFTFQYTKDIDLAYNNISDEKFKYLIDQDLKLSFDNIFSLMNLDSEESINYAISELNSPLCQKKQVINSIVSYIAKKHDTGFINNVLYPILQKHNLLSDKIHKILINSAEKRIQRYSHLYVR